ncbi:hypothetical protein [Flavobacterium sp. B183]|uniref:hypothetical protein n=1 Tax=Flavobacterium sp. B183 TaxID=907046 RepID=UPI00201E90C4|nr:hypothetical protein [Flavobacterium sp. B183]URC14405.1 hypothetical protein M4I44_08450 [Flavobacterium sp. B183]
MKNIKKMAILLMVLGVAVLTGRCVSEEAGSEQKIEQSIKVSQARVWFEQYQSKVKIDSSFKSQVYNWDSAITETFENGSEAIVVPVRDKNLSDAYIGQKVLYLYPLENKKEFSATLYEILPLSESLEKIKTSADLVNFNGYIIAWDLEKGFVNGAKFENSNTTAALTGLRVISSEESERLNKSTAKSDSDPFELDEVIIRREKAENKQEYGGGGSGGGSYGGSLKSGSKGNSPKGYVKSPGGGGGNGSSGSMTINLIASGPKIDPKKENKCFDLSKSAELTIYIQQGKEGTRELVGPNEVGHVFIGIKQDGIVRCYGFYPETGANTAMVAVGKNYSSELRDNSKEIYHLSITKSISADQLNSIIKYANNPPSIYNVNSYACTDFGIAVGKLGGINLPSTKASSFTFNGTSPGNLGEDVRNGNFLNTTKTTTKSNAPQRKGDCN